MPSGRKPRIMIACVTFETVKVAEPVEFYEANKVYLIHYHSTNHPVYKEFYDRTVDIIRENNGDKVEIVEVEEKVWKFADMLRTVAGIIDKEIKDNGEQCEIYINISAGSPEYTAAAAIGSMMYGKNVVPFATSTDEYTVESDEDVRRCYFAEETGPDGAVRQIPVGLSRSIKEPVQIPKFFIKKPQKELVLGLKIYKKHAEQANKRYKRVTAPAIIEDLKAAGLWNHSVDPADEKRARNEKSSNAVYFHREFIERWLKHDWIKRDDSGKRYIITDEGQRVMDTFYTDETHYVEKTE